MKPQKNFRWQFDLLALVGVSVLALSYWFHQPHPRWRVPIGQQQSERENLLGFASDPQVIVTLRDFCVEGLHLPDPILNQRDREKGTFIKDYPLQVPPEDRARLYPDRGMALAFDAKLSSNKRFLIARQRVVNNTQEITRLYEPQNGQCLSNKPMVSVEVWGVLQPDPQSPLLALTCPLAASPPRTFGIYDAHSGVQLCTFAAQADRTARSCMVTPDQQRILLVWQKGKAPDHRWDIEVYQFQRNADQLPTWKKQACWPMAGRGNLFLCATNEKHLFLQSATYRDPLDFSNRLEVYKFQPERTELELDLEQPCQGMIAENGWFYIDPSANTVIKTHYLNMNPALPNWINTRLEKFGISIAKKEQKQSYFVYDLGTGNLRRQLTNATNFTNTLVFPSQNGMQLIGIEEMSRDGSRTIALSDIPHWLWEWTWSMMFYVGLGFLFLWPFRFLFRKTTASSPVLVSP
jgi:hypothetical protein